MSGAIHHYRRALRMEPSLVGPYQFLHVPSCYEKFHLARNSETRMIEAAMAEYDNPCKNDFTTECLNRHSITKLEGMDTMIFCTDGSCKFVTEEDIQGMKLKH